MLTLIRAGLAVVFVAFATLPALAADNPGKAFQRSELDEAAIKLEADIKRDAGTITETVPALRQEAEAALARSDYRTGLTKFSQLITIAPANASNWLQLARTLLDIKPRDDKEKAFLLQRASTASYIAYQRAGDRNDEAAALSVLGRSFVARRQWRDALDTMRLSLGLRETAALRAAYEKLRIQYGFRMLDFSVDSDATSPRACFQFSENLPGKRTDFSPYVVVAGQDKPAISVNDRQLCVGGLKHGERYVITLRAGLPSTVHESLAKTINVTVFVRDRQPFVRFSGKAYVLPRTGQRGIPVLSVNSKAIEISVYRVGDRNLIDTVLGYDFQRNLSGYQAERLATERGEKVWSGELAVTPKLNVEVTTAFPVDEALGNLKPGVYAMTARPKEQVGNTYDQRATQWFIVSDLGLTAYSGHDGIDVFIHSLASAAPDANVEVRLVARDNEVLATRRTDKNGFAHFEAGLTRGEGGLSPAAIIASTKNAHTGSVTLRCSAAGRASKGDGPSSFEARAQSGALAPLDDGNKTSSASGPPCGELMQGGSGGYAFLSLKAAAFDLSDRGVGGRPVPVGLDAFVYTERGVYRTGETVHVTSLLRDARGIAALNAPLTLVMKRPDGVEYRRALIQDQGLGGRSWDVPIVASAMTGTWRVRAFTDPKRPPVGETTFLVEDYVPDRIQFDLTSDDKSISRTKSATLSVDGNFLYGAPASHLDLSGAVNIAAAPERPGFSGYSFGLDDEQVTPLREDLGDLPQTDAQGQATFPVAIEKMPATSRPLEATVTISMADAGGRAVERKLTLPVTPDANMIGVKPLFTGRALADGANADFDIVMITPDGKMLAHNGLKYELLKIETSYQWYRQNGQWEFEPIKRTERVANGTVDAAADKPGHLSLPVQWGRYRLEVSTGDADGPMASISFDAGFYAESSADTPDLLEIALDKSDYKTGDSMNVAVTARTAGRLTINVFTDRLVASKEEEVKGGTVYVPLIVGKDWGTGAYVVATLRRPLDAPAKRMPGRAIGVQWFGIDRAAHTLALSMDLPAIIRPDTMLDVPVRVAGFKPGDDVRLVVAAVDVGILNLTNYKPPAPDDYYLGQRRLTAEIRDLYGQLIDGMQGVRGAIHTGGDIGAESLTGSPPVQPPLALYSGIVTVGSDGTAHIRFAIPAFSGTVRVMAVGWSKDKVGRANSDVVVRDPVVLSATLPRFLRTGDKGSVQLVLDNVEGAAGDYTIGVGGQGTVVVADDTAPVLTLAQKQRGKISVPISARDAGSGTIAINVSGPNGYALSRAYTIDVRPATQTLTRRTVRALTPGETLTLDRDMFADFAPGTGRVALSVAISTSLDAAALLDHLDRYPFGCSEQVASTAMAMLYINELAGQAHLAIDGDINTRIRDAISRLFARQGSNGSFGLWSVGGEDIWLDAYVTDFLTRARERGFQVPATAFTLALDRLRNYVASEQNPSKNGGRDLAYALYVLARNGAAPVGDLRYIADVKLGQIATPIGKAQIGAALAMLGDKTRADHAFRRALNALPPKPTLVNFEREDFGSNLRDAAALVTLASEGGAPQRILDDAVARVDAARAQFTTTSTQEDAWLVLAARALQKQLSTISLSVHGEAHNGALYRSMREDELAKPLAVTNNGDGTVQAVVSVSGSPLTPEPAADHGFKIERSYYTLEGKPVDPSHALQNQRFAVVLKVTEPRPQFGRVMLADYLPAGFEIDNPRLVSSGDAGTLPWISDAVAPVHTEFRDDRFTAAFDRDKGSPPVFTVAYVVRAVSPGHYVLPQAFVEDMYRPERFGRTATGTIDIEAAK